MNHFTSWTQQNMNCGT